MPEKKFLIEIPGKEGVSRLSETDWASNKDSILAKYPNANVVSIDMYDPEDIQDNDAYLVSIAGKDSVSQFSGVDWAKHKDAIMAKYPDAKVSRMRGVDYYYDQANELGAALEEKDAEIEAWQNSIAEKTGGSDWSAVMLQQNGLKPIGTGLDAERDEAIAAYVAEGEQLQEQKRQLQEAYDNNPRVKAANEEWMKNAEAEFARYQKEYLGNMRNQITSDMESDVDMAAAASGKLAMPDDDFSSDINTHSYFEKQKLEQYQAALQFLDKAEEARTGQLNGFWKGVGDVAKHNYEQLESQKDIATYADIFTIMQKLEKKYGTLKDVSEEQIERSLEPSEKALLKSYFEYSDAISQNSGDKKYKAGQQAGQWAQFAIEFALGGKVADSAAKGLSKGVVAGLERWAAKALQGTFKGIARNTLAKAGTMATRGLTNVAIATALRPSTYTHMAQAATTLDKRGHLNPAKEMSLSFLDDAIETVSEKSGEVIGKVLGVPLKPVKKWTSKAWDAAFGGTKFAEWGKLLTNGPVADYLKQAGFNGYPIEILEEYVGNAMRLPMDSEALKNMHQDGNGYAMLVGFLPATLIGSGISAAQFGFAQKRATNSAAALQEMLINKGFGQGRSQFLSDYKRDMSPLELGKDMYELKQGLEAKGASQEELQMVSDYATAVAEYQTLRGGMKEMQSKEREQVMTELEGQYKQFYKVDENGNKSVDLATDKNGRQYFITSPAEMGEFAAIDKETGAQVFLNESDINISENVSLDNYLDGVLQGRRELAQMERMTNERDEQIAKLSELLPKTLNLGTKGTPNEVVVKGKTNKGVSVVDAAGNEMFLSWDQVGRTMGMPIEVLTDAQIAEAEAAAYGLGRAEKKAQRATTQEEADSVQRQGENIAEEVKNATPKPEDLYRDQETGEVDENAFWENDPEGYCQWNDSEMQDNGADSLEQIESGMAAIAKRMAELDKMASDDPKARKVTKAEKTALQERLDRLVALQQGYTQASVSEEQRKAEQTLQYREKIDQWRKQYGVPVFVYESEEEVKDKGAVAQIKSATTPGWQNSKGVHIYLPHVDSMATLEETLKHETTGHAGFALLDEKFYNELMDKVWAMMSDSAKNTFYNYASVANTKDADIRRRKAAEEFASHVAEQVDLGKASAEQKTIWERIVDFFRRLFSDDNLDSNLIANAIRDNHLRLMGKAQQAQQEVDSFKAEAQEQTEQGLVPEEVQSDAKAADGTNNYSTATYHSWVDNLGNEHKGTREEVLTRMQNMGFSEAEIKDMAQRMDTAYAYMEKLRRLTNPDGTVRFDEFNRWAEKTPLYKQIGRDYVKAITSLVSNGDYPVNLEITTDCIKREAFTQLLNELVKRGAELSGMGPGEIVTIQKMMKQYGIEVACNLCFVEGKRLQIINWASQIVNDWNDALVEAGVETDEFFEFGKDGDAFIPAEEWRTYEDKSKVAKVMRNLDDIALLFQGLDPKTFKAQKRKNKKALDKYIKEKAEKAKKPVDQWKPSDEQKREMKKIANEGLYPTYVNENMEEYRNAFNAMRNEWLDKNPNADPLSFNPTQKQWDALGKIRNRQIDNVRAKMVRLIMEYPEMRKKMTLNDLLGSKGLMEIRQQHGQAYADLYSIILQRFGTGTPKPVQDAVPYDGEVMTLSESAFKKANEIGGARLFSFSDFDITKVFDYMQMFFDLEANRQMLQSYTKEVAAVLIFGRSNAKFNISTLANAIVPDSVKEEYNKASEEKKQELRHKWAEYAGLEVDAEGNIIGINFSEEHSVSPAFAQQIFHDDSRNKDCGAIMVGASVNHAIFSAAQQWIRMVIPFHLSGMPMAAREKTDVKWYTDNTAYQSTRKKTKDGWSKISSSEDTFKFYNDMNKEGWNMRDKTREYLAWCAEKGFRPKFDWGINSDYYRAYCEENGYTPNQQIIDMMDADTTDGVWNQYYKFLTDFTAYKPVFNEQGEMIDEIPSPQLPVQSNFDFSEMEKDVLFEGERSMLEHREGNIQRTNRHIEILAEQATAYLNGDITEEEMGLRDDVHFENTADAERYLEEVAKESGVNMYKSEVDNIKTRTLSDINSQFNIELQQQIDGTLPSGHVYQLGLPSNKLLGAGIANLPIELAASRLVDKSMQENHPYSLSDVENLPIAIQRPLAVFVSATHIGSHVILTELTAKGKNFVAALRVMPNKNKITVNQIRSLYPKSTMAIVDWISDELGTTFDRMKMLDWLETKKSEMLSKPQSNSVEVRKQFASATKVVKEFVNPTIPTTNMYKTRTDSQREKLFADAKERFGVTDNFKVAGYMLPDGSLLDFSEANDGGDPNQRSLDHRSIEDVIMEDGTEYDSRWMYLADFMNEGAIRLLPEYAGINLMKAPTKEQRQRLMDFIYKYNGEVILEIADERLNNAAYVEYDRRTSPARIFRDIDGYFNEGIVPQSNTMFKTSNNNQAIFVSNAAKAVEGIKMEKATPEQWLKMIEKNGGLKAGEDKWMGLSDWLKASDKKTLTKQEVLDFVNKHMIQIEEQHYGELGESNREKAMHDNMIKTYGEDFYKRFVGDAFIFEDSLYGGDWHLSIQFDDTAAELYNENNEDQVDYNEDEGGLSIQDKEKVRQWATAIAREMESVDKVRQINPTRLKYTTNGLKNKHEIALTVPTIEPYKGSSPEVHFYDAGEGRAVAWVRFGDASKWVAEQREDGKKGRTKKVLVIDEVQSQRHQEGREKGYTTKEDVAQRKAAIARAKKATNDLYDYIGELVAKYPGTEYSLERVRENRGRFTEDENNKLTLLIMEHNYAELELEKHRGEGVPDAPFDKNWHELAMKRMLRYAAENGYDVVAWTKGEQQAKRYGLKEVVNDVTASEWDSFAGWQDVKIISASLKNEGELQYVVDKEGKIVGDINDQHEGRNIAEVFGKEIAVKLLADEEVKLSNAELILGSEGMKGFYDKMLPAFMNKYGKKWGVKVEDIHLNLEGGLDMHSIPVTEEMKESVMEGQTMFKTRRPDQSAMSFTKQSMRDYVQEYGNVTYIEVMPVDEDTARELGLTLEELKVMSGVYRGKKGIAIFAREKNTDSDQIDTTIYHESVHHLHSIYPELDELAEYLWHNADEIGILGKIKKNILALIKGEEDLKKIEMLAFSMEYYAGRGEIDDLIGMVSDEEARELIEFITNKTKYGRFEKVREDSERGETGRDTDGQARKQGEGSGNAEGENGEGTLFKTAITPEVRREMDVISAQAIVNGNYMKAPNGKDSKLTPEQWALVRTQNFLNWAGDWMNDSENAAVVLDVETGEPLVLYHGTPRAGFTEFKGGWFTTSKEDAISYSGDRKGRMFDPNEKYEPEVLKAGDFRLGYMTFDSEEDRATFLAEHPTAESAMSESEYENARIQAEDEEYDTLTERKPELQKIWNAYREYERDHFVDTTIGEILNNPDAYTEDDLRRAVLAYDSNAVFDSIDELETTEERKSALVDSLNYMNEDAKENGAEGILDMVVATRVPRNGEGVKHNDLGNRTYEVYARIERPYEIDANGRGSEFESGDIYQSVKDALADEQYDGVIIRNWRVGRHQQLGDVVVPKYGGNQVKLTSNENPTESEDIMFKTRTAPAPTKTQDVYKLMRLGADGKLYPLFIGSAEPIELGTWYDAESPNLGDLTKLASGVHLVNNETGEAMTLEEFKEQHPEINIKGKRPNVAAINWATENGARWIEIEDKATAQRRYEGESRSYYNLGINGSGQVGQFAMRPGWHAGSLPTMRQIGKGKDKNLRDDSFVWVKGRIPADVDYQSEADANPDKDIPTHIPTDGFYMKATNANAKASQADKMGWYVAGSFIADEIISDAEARSVIDSWNAEHPDAQVEYDYPRESGREFDPNVYQMQPRMMSWLSDENIQEAKGKSRDEIIALFGNTPEPIAYLPEEYSEIFGEKVDDNNIYSGKGYFIDHAVNAHPELSKEEYLLIQDVLNNPDDLKDVSQHGNKSIAFVKMLPKGYAVVVQLDKEGGKFVWHKSFFYRDKNKPYANKPDIRLANSPEGGRSSIIRDGKPSHGSLLSARDEYSSENKGTNNSDTNNNSEENLYKTTAEDYATMPVDELVEKGKMRVSAENQLAADEFMDRIRTINGALDQLRMAAAAQRKYDQNTVKILASLANDLLASGKIADPTKGEVKRLVSVLNNATGKRHLEKSVERLMDIMIYNQLRHGRENLDKFLRIRGKKVDARGVEVKGRLDIPGQQIMDAIRDHIGMSLPEIEDRIAVVEDNLTSESEIIRRNAENELIGLEFAKQYVENIKQSENEEKSLRKEIFAAEAEYKAGARDRKSYTDFAKVTEEAIRENRAQRVLAYQRLIDALAEMVTKSIQGSKLFNEAEKERVAKIQHFANSDMQGLPADAHQEAESKFWNNGLVRLFTSPLATFEQWLRVFGAKSPEGKGYLYNHFMGSWAKATDQFYLGMKEANATLDAKARQVFGNKVERWSDLFAMEKELSKGRKHTITIWDDGEKREYEVTQGNLLYIYMVNKMIDGKMKLRKMGISEYIVEDIVREIDPRFITLADWIQNEFLPGIRDKYNAVHERLFGAPMAAIDNYFPIKVLANARVREVDLGAAESSAKPSTITGSIIKRTRNSLALDVLHTDAFDLVLEHIEQMEQWAAFAEFNRDLNTLLSYKKFRNRVQNMSGVLGAGKEAWNSFRETAEIAAGVYQPKTAKADKLVTNAVKGLTAGKISFRLWTALKQVLAMPAFLPYANPAQMVRRMATPWESWNWAMENLPAFEKRWKSREAGNVRLKKTEADYKIWQGEFMETATRLGMTPNAFVDAITCAIGSHSVFLTQKERYERDGYDEEQAIKKAKLDAMVVFNATQQSSESAFLSAVQSDRTFIAHALTVFRNNSFGMQREFVDALRNFRKRSTPGFKVESIEFMKKQMVRDGLTEDQAAIAAERVYNRSAFKDAARIATFGFLMQFLWNLGGSAIYLLFGDDDEEKDKMIKDAAIRGTFGSIEGLGFGNVITEGMAMAVTGDLKRFHPSLSPAGQDIESLWSELLSDPVAGVNELINILAQAGVGANPQVLTDAAVAIYDACDGDIKTSKEVGLAILRILQVPQSQIDKLKMDEIDFTKDKGLDVTIAEFAKEYAQYKKLRNAPLTHAAYSDEQNKKIEEKYIKRFLKDAEEMKRSRGNEEAKKYYEYLDTEYKEVTETINSLKKKAREEGMKGNVIGAMEYAEMLRDYTESDIFQRYSQFGSKAKAIERLRDKMMKVDPKTRETIEDAMLELRREMVEEMETANN